MKKLPNKSTHRFSSWQLSIKAGLQRVIRWRAKLIDYIITTHSIHKRYHSLLTEARKNLISPAGTSYSSLSGLRELTDKQKLQLEQLQTVREVYQRSVQRLYDLTILTTVGSILIFLAYLAVNPQPTVTVRMGIYSETVGLKGVLPDWSMNGAEESDQIIYTDKSITIENVDSIEHNNQHFVTANETGLRLTPIKDNGLPGQLNLYGFSFGNSDGRLSFEVRNNVLNLSAGTDGEPMKIKGTLCKNGCLGELSLEGGRSVLEPNKPIIFYMEAVGEKQMEIAFSKMPLNSHSSQINPLQFHWEDIPIRKNITFTRAISDSVEESTIESGWLYIFQTDDTIKLGKHDFLSIQLANKSLASVNIPFKVVNPEASEKLLLFTDATCEVSELKTGRPEFKKDQMPSRIQVLAEQKDKSLFFAILGLVATLFIPIILRNRL